MQFPLNTSWRNFNKIGWSELHKILSLKTKSRLSCMLTISGVSFRWRHFERGSGVARAFPGGRAAHPENQNEEEKESSLRKNKINWSKFEEKMRKVELLPTRDCEAGYGPGKRFLQVKQIKGHWTTSASSPIIFQKSWDFYTIRSVYLCSDCVLNFSCNFNSVTKIYFFSCSNHF